MPGELGSDPLLWERKVYDLFLVPQPKNFHHHSHVPDPNLTWGHEG